MKDVGTGRTELESEENDQTAMGAMSVSTDVPGTEPRPSGEGESSGRGRDELDPTIE